MARPRDPATLARERAALAELSGRPFGARVRGYLGLLGPGYLQSAMTLGGGTVSAALFAGAIFGYQLLWVAPLGMAMGLCMLGAVSWQTLSTGRRPWPDEEKGLSVRRPTRPKIQDFAEREPL